jgi:hypothetical protein
MRTGLLARGRLAHHNVDDNSLVKLRELTVAADMSATRHAKQPKYTMRTS